MSEESYIPSQTPESESVTTDYESSSLETPSESEYSIACSEDCSGSSDRSSSYFDSVSDSQTSIMTISSVSDAESLILSESDSSSSQSSTLSD